ncbi:hypothetical protein [Pseudonocardia lacus]|uniref:hypothetical protein n=1 Tax=Pseudonocardia lacus TaxID=2835865 RepID=UPI001BDCA822|nr:hypothetical protein [Pseudonocardia lacus]
MGWNVEVACVRTADPRAAVPDVFGPMADEFGFEDATSSARGADLGVGRVGEWMVVIDVQCRLSSAGHYLREASEGTDLHLVRIAGSPVVRHYHSGREVAAADGLEACLRIAPREDGDGELCAMDALALRTGVDFFTDLWTVTFTRFEVT